jgi:hypothetical protein
MSVAVEGAEPMTDYQFQTFLRMLLILAEETNDVEVIKKTLINMIGELKSVN